MKPLKIIVLSNVLLLLFLSLSLKGRAQVFELEPGFGVHFANIHRKSLSPKHNFQKNEKYSTKPSIALFARLRFGRDSFPVQFFMLGHFTKSFSIDNPSFFNNTINNDDDFIHYNINEGISQYSLYFGPGFKMPPIGKFQFELNLGAGISSISIPSVFFGCDNCFEPQLSSYNAHGGLGFGGIAEGSIAYKFDDKMRYAMTFSYHGGRIYNTSVETWLTGEGWNSTHDVPAPNIITWKNTLLSWSFVYTLF